MKRWRARLDSIVRYWGGRDAIEQMRPVFAIYALANIFLALPPIITSGTRIVPLAATFGAGIVLLTIWIRGTWRARFSLLSSFLELLAVLVFGLNLGQPAPLLNLLFGAIYLRGLYGSNRAAVLRCIGYLLVLESLAIAQQPAQPMQRPAALWTWVLPSFALATLVVRTVAVSVGRLTVARDLGAVLARTASELLTASSPSVVRSMVESCARTVVPDAIVVRLEMATDPALRPARGMAVFALVEDGRSHGKLLVQPRRPLSAPQWQTLRTVAAQATAAIEATHLRAMLIHRANHDALTGLPNRTLFREVLTRTLNHRNRVVATLFVDLDDFKVVNDTLGHPAGDALLIEVATRIVGCLRPGDVAARMGGDEFAVLLDTVGTGEATMIAKRILAALEEPFLVEGRLFNLHCSVGIAAATAEPDRAAELAAELVRDADMAMYVAKTRGKNRFEHFSATMAEAVMHDRRVRDQLSAALVRGELELHFQPIISLADGSVTSVESLVRWRHPHRGLLLPGDFLPQAEQVGLMPDLERWVIAEACQTAVTWAGGSAPAVAVNISPQHLARSWLVPVIRQALAASGLPGDRLVLEITEESAVLEPAAAASNLRECVALGVRVAMDDFGAGHASLRHIGALPISTVKIDRSLVGQDTGPVVIRSVVGLAHALGLQVVAEGVENPVQLAWLRDSDCDAVQGFLLARPEQPSALSLRRRPVTAIISGIDRVGGDR